MNTEKNHERKTLLKVNETRISSVIFGYETWVVANTQPRSLASSERIIQSAMRTVELFQTLLGGTDTHGHKRVYTLYVYDIEK
jgi:hypothetical protein